MIKNDYVYNDDDDEHDDDVNNDDAYDDEDAVVGDWPMAKTWGGMEPRDLPMYDWIVFFE